MIFNLYTKKGKVEDPEEPDEPSKLEEEAAEVPFSEVEEDYSEIINDIPPEDEPEPVMTPEVTEESHYEPSKEYENAAYEEEKEESRREIDQRLKDDGYLIKDKTERDVDMMELSKIPDPSGDKIKLLKSKKGIPKYIDRSGT